MALFRVESSASMQTRDFRVAARVSISVGRVHGTPSVRRGRQPDDLWSELASYSRPSELRDLEAALRRYDDEETEEIRSVLARQARGRLAGPQPHGA
jgi:hypothetical protein